MYQWLCATYDCDRLVFDDHGGFGCRHDALKYLVELAYKQSVEQGRLDHTPEKIAIYSGDRPHAQKLFPDHKHFSISDIKERAHMCFPCFNFGSWPEAGINDFDETVACIQNANLKSPVNDKTLWIGNLETHPNRHILWRISRDHQDLIECIPMKWTGYAKGTSYISLPEHTRWSSLIDVEGSGYSGRLKFLAHMARPLYVQDRPYWDWATAPLTPFHHYIPIKSNLGDLVDTILATKKEDTSSMVHRCNKFAIENITRAQAVAHAVNLAF